MERDRFFKADEAVEYGLIDRVLAHATSAGSAIVSTPGASGWCPAR